MPSHIGNATALDYFDVSTNHLEGEIPATIFSLIILVFLSLSGNKFTGVIHDTDNKQLPDVKVANNSSFLGESLSSFCQLTLLQLLDLSSNHLFGDLLIACGA